MRNFFRVLALIFLHGLLITGYAHAQTNTPPPSERITSFFATLAVREDGLLKVEERVTVYATGEKINHGIYRDFPTSYADRYGNRVRVNFTILSVERGGAPEAYRVENRNNGKRVYFGDANVTIPPGIHNYIFTYTVTRELGFFENHDELYWNVTGNGWAFQIEQATAEVKLPIAVASSTITATGYTGIAGSKAQELTSSVRENVVYFKALKPLNPGEGLTIVVGWPKGFVTEPTTLQKVRWFLKDNSGILVSGLLLLVLLTYYVWTWRKYGVDPPKGTIVAQYDPPQNLSAAGTFYIQKMGYRVSAFTAGVLALAVKGYIHITHDDQRYVLSKTPTPGQGASSDERALYAELFAGKDNVTLSNAEHKILQSAQSKQRTALTKELGTGNYFINNTKYFIFGFTLSVFVVVSAIALQAPTYAIVLAVLVCLCIDILFYNLLKKRTPAGQKLYEEIEGFKLYLSVAEKDRLNFHNPPERTPELFEKLLPFALALGVEHKWADQFADVFKKLTSEGNGNGYTPLWYTGAHFSARTIDEFSSSFSTAISSSSTPPGSSSGFGGGGSSGGGGGGGGGGGW